ncbi:MAG: heavy metal translocating P-type ATPase [Candidatus Hodarchaeota archaeon]
MDEHSQGSCKACNAMTCSINDDELEEGQKDLFTRHFWKFMAVSGTFLALSILSDFVWESIIIAQVFAMLSIAFSGYDVFTTALKNIKEKQFTASILMVVAAIGAFFILHGEEGAIAIFLYSIAEKLEDISADKARDAVSKLVKLTPDVALLKTSDGVVEVSTRNVNVGDTIVIKPGMKVPLDGIITAGTSYFDTHSITGESVPRKATKGDMVYASSINGDGLVELEVACESKNTLLARITESIKTAQKNKTNTEKFIQKFARYYTPIIFLVSLTIMTIPWLLFGLPLFDGIYRGLMLLVISCPCALTLSTPLSMVASLTKLSREGIMVKGGKYIEELEHVKMFGFDKTATLTEGKLKVFDNIPYEKGFSKEENLMLISSLESNSDHPIAKAIIESAKDVEILKVDDFQEVKGKGIKGKIQGTQYHVGSIKYLEELGINVPLESIAEYTVVGKTPVLLAKEKTFLGLVTIRDNLRVSAPILLRGLKRRKIKSMIISGDTQGTVDSIGDCLYIDERYGQLLPEDKLEKIKEIQSRGINVSMVGDGINDAPALSQSNVGIAMGGAGTDIALESADVTILNDDLTKILVLLDIKKITNTIIRQNIWLSIIIKITFAVLTVLGFMNLAIAVGIGDMGVSLMVILNGFRVFQYKSKFQGITEDELEVEATRLICNNCQTTTTYPQHHGREMVKRDGDLVCWKSLVAEISADACKEKLSLACPECDQTREIL